MKKVGATDGQFIIRRRAEDEYVMVLMFRGRPTHHLIKHDRVLGSFTMNGKGTGGSKTLDEVWRL